MLSNNLQQENEALHEHGKNQTEEQTLIRLPQVLRIFPVSKTVWYQGIKDGIYPRGTKIARRSVAWSKPQIEALCQKFLNGER